MCLTAYTLLAIPFKRDFLNSVALMIKHLRHAAFMMVILCVGSSTWGADQIAHSVHLVGSASIFPYAVFVAEMLNARTQGPSPVIESTGTGGGIRVFCSGPAPRFPDAVMASRPMSKEEIAYCKNHGVANFIEVMIGRDGIVLASASPKPFVRHLSRHDARRALENSIDMPKSWKDLKDSLPAEPLRVLGPPSTSGTQEALTHLLGSEQQAIPIRRDGGYQEVTEQEAVVLQKLQLQPYALGVFSFGFAHLNRDRLNTLAIDGVKPSLDSIMRGTYPLSRTLFLYIKVESLKQHQSLEAFMEELLSDAASGPDGYLTDFGFVPLRPEERHKALEEIRKVREVKP